MVYASKSGDPSKSRKSSGELASDVSGMLTRKLNRIRKKIQEERVTIVREKIEKNRKSLESYLFQLTSSKTDMGRSGAGNMLSSRIENPLFVVSIGSGDKDDANNQEVATSVSAKIELVDKIPPYTTWSFLSRNQRMAEDQSVVGRRQIYYDREQGNEALVCTDSEEEIGDQEEEKHEFTEAEDRILRMVVEEFEPDEDVLNILTQFIDGSTSEIQDRCTVLQENKSEKCNDDVTRSGEVANDKGIDLEKSLSASLDSLDNIFCRRCLVFDCRLHGYSQTLIWPSERNFYSSESEEERKPCGDHCYLQLNNNTESSAGGAFSRTATTTLEEERGSEVSVNTGKRKISKKTSSMLEDPILVSDHLQSASCKKQKLSPTSTVATAIEGNQDDDNFHDKTEDLEVGSSDETEVAMTSTNAVLNLVEGQAESIQRSCHWKPLEKELYLKGIEIFGRNSCLIARNLLPGLKTCIDVSKYMDDGGSAMSERCLATGSLLGHKEDGEDCEEREMPSRSRLLRKRGKTRKLKYTRKSAGHSGTWRRIADGKDEPCRQYTPCECDSLCGKNCPCAESKTCCEKYCGCSKSCKNRFRGCHCAKSQCRSRQCPCFAAQRECDPDVCRNCWVSCGDGSLGEPPKRGDGQCGNMRLLLRQQQRILLGKSDVAGWGAFLKNPVDKNDYLGEYTGEIISHREADKRGKIYDRTNSSFLFDLNDQYVLDAYRKGDKLKFANHSANPNCYARIPEIAILGWRQYKSNRILFTKQGMLAQVMLVGGNHRVGIFAKKPIEASEEIFYDYHYKPDARPVWARKLDGTKGNDSTVPQGRAKKHQSY